MLEMKLWKSERQFKALEALCDISIQWKAIWEPWDQALGCKHSTYSRLEQFLVPFVLIRGLCAQPWKAVFSFPSSKYKQTAVCLQGNGDREQKRGDLSAYEERGN